MKEKKLIDITGSIIISKNQKEVFDYLSNFANDKFWRKEINATTIDSEQIKNNSLITQDSFLSNKFPNHISKLKCITLQPNTLLICETTNENEYWQKNTRQTTSLSENTTEVTYNIQFDKQIVKHGLGFSLPTFLINIYTKKTMRKYLSVLKNNLENKTSVNAFQSS